MFRNELTTYWIVVARTEILIKQKFWGEEKMYFFYLRLHFWILGF